MPSGLAIFQYAAILFSSDCKVFVFFLGALDAPVAGIHRVSSSASINRVFMNRCLSVLLSGICFLLLGGCASPGLDKTDKPVDVSRESIAIMSVNMTNQTKPDYVLQSLRARFVKAGSSSFQFVDGTANLEPQNEDILLSVKLAPGTYELSKFVGFARRVLIAGAMDFSIKATVEIAPQSVVYLGHVRLVNIEKTNKDDQATGSAFPLIDQALSGFSNGTISVGLVDRFDRDVESFKKEYPALRSIDILRAPLKQIVVPRAFGSKADPVIVLLESAKN